MRVKRVNTKSPLIPFSPPPPRRRFDASNGDLERYAHFDASKKYTRNLIATDGETFTLMLLCWTPGKESPIHDHPCDGCWMRVVDGTVFESKFRRDVASNRLEPLGTAEATPGEVIYINDQIALHKVGNPSPTEGAVTLHLYSPPFRQCQVWLERMGEGVGPTLAGGEGEAAPLPVLLDRGLKTIVTFHSEFGEVLLHEQQAGGPAAGAGGPSLCK